MQLTADGPVSLVLQKSVDGVQWRDVAASGLNVAAGRGSHHRGLGYGATTSEARPGRAPRGHRFYRLQVAAGADLSENLGRYASGSLRVLKITADEGVNQAFIESHKINTGRTYDGQSGIYLTNGYLKSSAGSDFLYWDWGRVIDRACRIVYDTQQLWLLKKVRVLTDGTGRINPLDAVRIESAVRSALKDGLLDPINVEGFAGHVSGLEYMVDLTNNVLTTRQLKSTLRLVPLPPIESIATEIGFTGSLAA